jgi:hypothetical protein
MRALCQAMALDQPPEPPARVTGAVQPRRSAASAHSLVQEKKDLTCRKRHEPRLPVAPDDPGGPPPEESLYRCAVCGEERLFNAAIIDVAIGAVTFRGV